MDGRASRLRRHKAHCRCGSESCAASVEAGFFTRRFNFLKNRRHTRPRVRATAAATQTTMPPAAGTWLKRPVTEDRVEATMELLHKAFSPSATLAAPSPARKRLRPWDEDALARRLSTFSLWCDASRSAAANARACAALGWTYVGNDVLECEACAAKLRFEGAGDDFVPRLNAAHAALCPWRDNPWTQLMLVDTKPPQSLEQALEQIKDI